MSETYGNVTCHFICGFKLNKSIIAKSAQPTLHRIKWSFYRQWLETVCCRFRHGSQLILHTITCYRPADYYIPFKLICSNAPHVHIPHDTTTKQALLSKSFNHNPPVQVPTVSSVFSRGNPPPHPLHLLKFCHYNTTVPNHHLLSRTWRNQWYSKFNIHLSCRVRLISFIIIVRIYY